MYQPASGKLRVYEVRFYNSDVRNLTSRNESHSLFEDHWGETQIQKINAFTESEARDKIVRRYPPEQGFVVETVFEAQV